MSEHEKYESWSDLCHASEMLRWFPAVEESGVPHPRTEIIPVGDEIRDCLDDAPVPGMLIEAIIAAGDKFGWPIFLRTGQTSGKHDWKDTCFVAGPDDVITHVYNLVEDCALKDLDIESFVVREFLSLKAEFTAFFGEMPVAREFRLFIKAGELEHIQFYWPAESIEKPSCEDWLPRLQRMAVITDAEKKLIVDRAVDVCRLLGPESWSVDFAQGNNDEWYLIDMARGEVSFDTRRAG